MSCSHSLRHSIRRFPIRLFVALLCLSLLSITILPGRAVSSAPINSSGARRAKTSAIAQAQAQAPRRENELLIRFRPSISEQQKESVAASIGARRKQQLRGESGVERVEIPASLDLQTTALQLLLNPAVEFAEPNFLIKPEQFNPIIPDDARFGEQWALRNVGDNGGQFGSDIEIPHTKCVDASYPTYQTSSARTSSRRRNLG